MIDFFGTKRRVALGASRLDWVVPGWHEMVDLEWLSINHCEDCVLGQIYGNFHTRDIEAIGHISECIDLGFFPRYHSRSVLGMIGQWIDVSLLDRAWRRQIERRLRTCATSATESTARR